VTRLEEAVLSKTPGLLAEEAGAISMFGGSKAVWVSGADAGFAKAVEPILKDTVQTNVIVAEAGVLAKAAPLRVLFEQSENAVIVPVYEASDEETALLVRRQLDAEGKTIGQVAVARLVELLRRDQGAAAQEVEKLVAYAGSDSEITEAMITAVCSAGGEEALDAMTDAVFGGDVEEADRTLMELLSAGTDSGRLAMVLHGHAVRLLDFKLKVLAGQQVEAVVRGARPVIFFDRVGPIAGQLRSIGLEELVQMSRSLASATERTRTEPTLAVATVSRAVMAVSRLARSQRQARG
jgi:DNA polymerase-3 subunit delta